MRLLRSIIPRLNGRGFSALAFPNSARPIYISESTDPYYNLSLEDWLFRSAPPQEPLLFIYRNSPCVVIGRNQNPWKEVNLTELKRREIPFLRRRSGGGTVYHDAGNTNVSIHLPRAAFDRNTTSQVFLRAVLALGVQNARINDRNDLCVGENKISSAYKIVNKRAYHHATMLISTHLESLGTLLRTNKEAMITKGVPSVRSPVCNLHDSNPNISHQSFTSSVVQEFRREYDISQSVADVRLDQHIGSNDDIERGMAELKSWEWNYGQTPEFTYTIANLFAWADVEAKITAKHGVILSLDIHLKNSSLSEIVEEQIAAWSNAFTNERYGSTTVEKMGTGVSEPQNQISRWLFSMMAD